MFADLQSLSTLLTEAVPEKKHVPSCLPESTKSSKDIWDADEVQQDASWDPRPDAEYDIQYRQNLASEDIFLGLGMRQNSISDADSLVVTVQLPGVALLSDITLDVTETRFSVRCPTFKLDLDLAHKVNEKRGDAQWDNGVLKVVLPIIQ